jgi:deoxyribonuclease (pyrimidine dimer)
MTRINTIPPSLLTDQHLMAEYREMPMVNASLARTLRSKRGLQINRIPPHYTLNSGHVMFHYNKGLYLFKRFTAIVEELNSRHYNIDPSSRVIDWDVFKAAPNLWNDWNPSFVNHRTNVERIVERIRQKPSWYRYQGTPIDNSFVDTMYSRYLVLQEV